MKGCERVGGEGGIKQTCIDLLPSEIDGVISNHAVEQRKKHTRRVREWRERGERRKRREERKKREKIIERKKENREKGRK